MDKFSVHTRCVCVWMEGREDTLKLYRETTGTLAIQCVHSYSAWFLLTSM